MSGIKLAMAFLLNFYITGNREEENQFSTIISRTVETSSSQVQTYLVNFQTRSSRKTKALKRKHFILPLRFVSSTYVSSPPVHPVYFTVHRKRAKLWPSSSLIIPSWLHATYSRSSTKRTKKKTRENQDRERRGNEQTIRYLRTFEDS